MASPTLDATDKAQRLRRLNDCLSELHWLKAIYPLEQNTDIYLRLSSATICLREAVAVAREEVEP